MDNVDIRTDSAVQMPVFDGESYRQVGEGLIEAARQRPELGLRLGAEGAAAGRQPCWYVGTQLSAQQDGRQGDVRFSAGTPYLRDLAHRMVSGDFGTWVAHVAEAMAMGMLYRVNRPARAAAPEPAVAAGPVLRKRARR